MSTSHHHRHFADSPSKSGKVADHQHSVGLRFTYCPLCAAPLEPHRHEGERPPRPRCARCGYVHYLDPKVAACTIPAVDGKVVLLRRAINPEKGKWVFPGGFVDRGEKVEHAAVRETREELGIEVEIERLLNVYSYENFDVIIIVYLARMLRGELRPGAEAAEARLFSPEEIPWDALAFRSTREALEEWVALRSAGDARG
ncbi:MAG: NUDIX hydrolase [Candidatus Tectomicrobia bacterium]|nr:NUDIX hydrolase [Candidatus Tectomicrobia bacterium]